MSRPAWVLANVVAQFQTIVAELELISSSNDLDATIAGNFILQVASAPAISASTPATLSPVQGLSAAMIALYNVIPDLVQPTTGIDPSLSQGIVSLASALVSSMDATDAVAAFGSAADNTADPAEPPFAPSTANRQADAANQSLVVRFARMVYLSAYVQALVTQDWPVRTDAITARADCVGRFDRELNLTSGGGEIDIAEAMIKLRNAAVNYLTNVIINAKPILDIQAPSLPVLWWAWLLNPQDLAGMASALISMNGVPTAEFMPEQFEAFAA
jgi:hypothetical protein